MLAIVRGGGLMVQLIGLFLIAIPVMILSWVCLLELFKSDDWWFFLLIISIGIGVALLSIK